MFVSKDGSVTGSIDVSKLDLVEPKTDEARAQLDALKAELQFGQERTARDAERIAEQHEAQAALMRDDDIVRNINDLDDGDHGKRQKSQADQQKDAERQQREADEKQQADEKAKQAEAASAARKPQGR